jgi:Fe-S-cluster-containing hydrogenase component 2
MNNIFSHILDQCPVSALAMIDDLPQVDGEGCIACFCCQEMCPEQVIRLS